MLLYSLVTYRLDLAIVVLLAIGGLAVSARVIRGRVRSGMRTTPPLLVIGVAVLLAVGGALAEFGAQRQREFLASNLAGFGPTYAAELQRAGHGQISAETKPDDPVYLRLIALEKEWLQLNPLISDIYTFQRDRDGRVRMLVDAETDYDQDGAYVGEREARTPIGEVYEEATPEFFTALDGKQAFDTSMAPDRWGVWISSLTPIFDAQGNVTAAVGIDYPADTWLVFIAIRRGLVLLTVAFLIAIVLLSATLHILMRGEIMERAETERQLLAARDAADVASRAKGEFLAVMSHEIRTPLTAITGYASMLEDTPLDALQQRYIRTLRRGAASLVELLNNILDYSKIEDGKLQLEETPCAPAETIREVLELLSAGAREKQLAVTFDDHIGDALIISTDAARLRQVLTNLVGNAVKFTAQGSVTVTAKWAPARAGEERGTLTVSVSDTGPGISPEKLPKLFQMFAQGDARTARVYGGSGLGLAISRRLVEMLGGTIDAQSAEGAGATFTFTIPARRMDAPRVASEFAPRRLQGHGRLLVVDDNAVNCEVLGAMLGNCGFEIDVANSGAAAIELAGRNRYTAILMDVAMPEMDGLTATRRIRAAEGAAQRVPIIAVTAASSKSDRESCETAGMDAFLNKPVDREQLLATLATFLSTPATPPETPS